MSIFASQTTATLPMPSDPGQTITIRKLTGREHEQAQRAFQSGLNSVDSRGFALTFKRMLATGATDADVVAAIADPLTGYDRFSIIRSGVLAWSYPVSIKPTAGRPAVPAKDGKPAEEAIEPYDAIGDLDDEAADFIATEILRLTKPGLFLTPEQREAVIKNG